MTDNIAEALQRTQQAIQQIKLEHQLRQDARLIAVSKTKPAEAIAIAYQAGQRAFGENYVQELQAKAQQLASLSGIEWHFIGPIQSNKTRDIARYADWVHSVDRLKIAERLSAQRPAELAPLKVLLQINISAEESKAGVAPEDMLALAQAVAALPGLELKGLMAIPEPGNGPAAFARMAKLSAQLQQQQPQATELSMGMSDDWPDALRCGATMIRLGTAIFGARDYSNR
ncbi:MULTISPECIES: YggS family pyridoxal phosphate-dependent enzyme [Rheinheimera]|uniref:Pyridoxal phosphate homeostasis protein n=1 Tax=Rheinheimera marina TaxID=1774958 RepID=A0ABV9JK07_9GAMM